ncbi:MAG: CotH kinase family protein, partial [Planctomycetales bacterium]|nr:CotH kinase family protein [Planctomycetales bacterium]
MGRMRSFDKCRNSRIDCEQRKFESLETRTLLAADLVISELMASNRATLDDGNGRSSDWIEIHNRGDEAADLLGWYLSDDAEDLTRWQFPDIQIGADSFLIVFASGYNQIDQDGFVHTNFKLSARGESVSLVDPANSVVDQITFGEQYTDVSYGIDASGGDKLGYFDPATPGTANGNAKSGVTESTVAVSRNSGVFTDSFSVELTSDAAGGTIMFTLDGSVPNGASFMYSQPITVTKSIQIRARVQEAGKVLGPITTVSYSKLAADVAGYQSDIPVMVLDNYGAGDIPNTGWNQTNTGIHQLPRQAANIMLFGANENGSQLTADADLSSRIGVRIRGAFSSTFAQPGYSMEAWTDHADVDRSISPLGIASDSDWVLYAPNPQYDETLIDNSFLFELSNQMGQWAPEVRYVEAFVNDDGGDVTMDDYAGIYVITEKVKRTPDRIDFEEFALDGTSGGWLLDINRMDPIALDGTPPKNFHTAGPDGRLRTERDLDNSSSVGDDIPRQYNAYINYDDPSGLSINPVQRDAISNWFDKMETVLYGRAEGVEWDDPVNGYVKHIDVQSFIDYFILNDISHNGDGLLISLWIYNSDPNGDGKLKFGPIWDADLGSYSGVATTELMRRKTELWYGQLFRDPNFELQYSERWQELRQSVLSDENMSRTIDSLYEQIGDQAATRSRVPNWRTRLDRMQTWLSQRAAAIDELFVPTPTLSQNGGEVSSGFELDILARTGEIYYTLDGSDPRQADGQVSPNASKVEVAPIPVVEVLAPASVIVPDDLIDSMIGTEWTSPDFVEGAAGETWINTQTGVGYDDRNTYDPLFAMELAEFTNLSMYVRIPFEITQEQLPALKQLVLNIQYDDGFIAYINGTEVARSNAPGNVGDPVPLTERATQSNRARAGEFEPFYLQDVSLHVGTNYLAIQGLNRSRTGGDLLIRPELFGVAVVSPPIILREPTIVTARVLDDDKWSPAAMAEFTIAGRHENDLNADGEINSLDIDRLCAAIRANETAFDLNDDATTDRRDLEYFIRERLNTV